MVSLEFNHARVQPLRRTRPGKPATAFITWYLFTDPILGRDMRAGQLTCPKVAACSRGRYVLQRSLRTKRDVKRRKPFFGIGRHRALFEPLLVWLFHILNLISFCILTFSSGFCFDKNLIRIKLRNTLTRTPGDIELCLSRCWCGCSGYEI